MFTLSLSLCLSHSLVGLHSLSATSQLRSSLAQPFQMGVIETSKKQKQLQKVGHKKEIRWAAQSLVESLTSFVDRPKNNPHLLFTAKMLLPKKTKKGGRELRESEFSWSEFLLCPFAGLQDHELAIPDGDDLRANKNALRMEGWDSAFVQKKTCACTPLLQMEKSSTVSRLYASGEGWQPRRGNHGMQLAMDLSGVVQQCLGPSFKHPALSAAFARSPLKARSHIAKAQSKGSPSHPQVLWRLPSACPSSNGMDETHTEPTFPP